MAGESRLEFSLVRHSNGQALIEVADPSAGEGISLPEEACPDLGHLLPTELARLLKTLVSNLPPISRGVSFWAPRPPDGWGLTTSEFVQRCENHLPKRLRRFVRSFRTAEAPPLTPTLSESDIRACTDLALHQWRRIAYTDRWRCAICGGAAERLLPPMKRFESLLQEILTTDPWRTAARAWFGRWSKDEEREGTFRILIDTHSIRRAPSEDMAAIRYLVERSPHFTTAVRLNEGTAPGFLNDVPEGRISVTSDVHGEKHANLLLPNDEFGGRTLPLGPMADLAELAKEMGGGKLGFQRARTARAGAEFGHMTATTDPQLLAARASRRGVSNTVSPRAAAIASGMHARRQGYLPIDRGIGVTPDYYYEDRVLALVPEFAGYLEAAQNAHAPGLKARSEMRLWQSAVDRLRMMARAEDEIAFRYFFDSTRGRRNETLYHFEYFLLLARALIEGLARLAATVHEVENPRRPEQLSWDLLLRKLKEDKSELVSFLRAPRVDSLSHLVARLRDPIAHAERWEEISSGSPSNPFAHLVIAGSDAEAVARAIRSLDGDPARWGAEGRRLESGDLQLWLDPYPFSVQLNVHLMTFTSQFLVHLSEGAGRPIPSDSSPWNYVNPPMTKETFTLVRLMSWPLLPKGFFLDDS